MTVAKYFVKIIIKAGRANTFLEDEKVVFLLVNEAEDFNQKVLVNEFKYEKLT